ncbi:unnamed protein product [Oppiella nova]|uniref:Uncharacterized protein n=1 Tax=Oppiella nova TaxID=334625 RepID=A0A7R9LPF6_9ACAR|nr:unnamed protein product [Oppiella nova]CAG2165660.1 unnamed protein product [Oppiella nova]
MAKLSPFFDTLDDIKENSDVNVIVAYPTIFGNFTHNISDVTYLQNRANKYGKLDIAHHYKKIQHTIIRLLMRGQAIMESGFYVHKQIMLNFIIKQLVKHNRKKSSTPRLSLDYLLPQTHKPIKLSEMFRNGVTSNGANNPIGGLFKQGADTLGQGASSIFGGAQNLFGQGLGGGGGKVDQHLIRHWTYWIFDTTNTVSVIETNSMDTYEPNIELIPIEPIYFIEIISGLKNQNNYLYGLKQIMESGFYVHKQIMLNFIMKELVKYNRKKSSTPRLSLDYLLPQTHKPIKLSEMFRNCMERERCPKSYTSRVIKSYGESVIGLPLNQICGTAADRKSRCPPSRGSKPKKKGNQKPKRAGSQEPVDPSGAFQPVRGIFNSGTGGLGGGDPFGGVRSVFQRGTDTIGQGASGILNRGAGGLGGANPLGAVNPLGATNPFGGVGSLFQTGVDTVGQGTSSLFGGGAGGSGSRRSGANGADNPIGGLFKQGAGTLGQGASSIFGGAQNLFGQDKYEPNIEN